MKNNSKILIHSLYNSYYFIHLNTNWIYEKSACIEKNARKGSFGTLQWEIVQLIQSLVIFYP